MVEHADAALSPSRAGESARDARRPRSRHRDPNGGGFGGKSDPFNHEIVVAAFARRTGRPVKIALTREEVFYCHRGRHPTLMRIKTGVKRDGRIVAMDFTFLDGGAYGSYGVASTYYTGALQTVTYEVHTIAFGALASSPTRHPVGRSAGTERRSRDSRSSARSTRSPKTCRSIRRCLESASFSPPIPSPRTGCASDRWDSASASMPWSSAAGGRRNTASFPSAAAWASPARRTSSARGCRSTGTACRTRGVQLKLDRSGGVAAFCGSTDIVAGIRLRARVLRGGCVRHRAGRHPHRHRRYRPDASSTSAPTRRASR